jgi:anti-sigma factor ChrR (cupin superfamily)
MDMAERSLRIQSTCGQSSDTIKLCEWADSVCAYVLQAVAASEMAGIQAHIASCPRCRDELGMLSRVVDRLVFWATDVLRPASSLQERLAVRISQDTGEPAVPPPAPQWSEPDWQQVAPGIECKLLATDTERQRVSMLVRLAPKASYPAHTHADVEELYLLDGELWINDRKLHAGDYSCRTPGTNDYRVWSEAGCSCLLVTSTADLLQ